MSWYFIDTDRDITINDLYKNYDPITVRNTFGKYNRLYSCKDELEAFIESVYDFSVHRKWKPGAKIIARNEEELAKFIGYFNILPTSNRFVGSKYPIQVIPVFFE